MTRSIGPELRRQWHRLDGVPGGKWLFSRLLGRFVPYTGTLGARIEVLEPGHCVVRMNDRRKIRNHLNSVHAMALANLGEMATGLALMNSLPDNTRGILKGFNVEYLKKARGLLLAECRCEIPDRNAEQEVEVLCEIRSTTGDVVTVARAQWLIGPEKPV
ncbi:MAG: hotdog fold domain-containing protein [Gammaproteobacteria bacterium]|nr:hotdog fold domain-containing protein [Gammaproteobacteria bacterium]